MAPAFGDEFPRTCSLHFGSPIREDGDCSLCLLAGLKVVQCDPANVEQVLRAMQAHGGKYVPARSRAVLVFERVEGPARAGDFIPRKPAAHVAGKVISVLARRAAQ